MENDVFIESQPLMPLSGRVPISIDPENKAALTLTLSDQRHMQEQIAQGSLPWIPILLVPILAIALLIAVLKLRGRPNN